MSNDFFKSKGWSPFDFQIEAWKAYAEGKSGIVNAPTGSGKTYSLFIPVVEELKTEKARISGLYAIWITPIRALAEEIKSSAERVLDYYDLNWSVGIRTGDTSQSERAKQTRKMPQLLITTPESLHLLLAQKGYPERFMKLKAIIVDEWHELLGSKRGVQVQLGISRLRNVSNTRVWGISATIGNMEEAIQALMGTYVPKKDVVLVKSTIEKKIEIKSVYPDEVEKFPWAGHLGIKLLEKVVPLIEESESSLVFTNTRSQTEIWYQRLLDTAPHLAGQIAMHHGSIAREVRNWVEWALHEKKLKCVVCTSSLDLGVDFRPVETIIQIGSPRGVARFMQRAGRSGHQPGKTSRIYFVPTHSLELLEGAALREAIKCGFIEDRKTYNLSFDVLIQYLVTLAISEGYYPEELYDEVKSTYAYKDLTLDQWADALEFVTTGGEALHVYDEYKKVEILNNGLFKVNSRRIATQHRLSIGTIVGDNVLMVKYMNGANVGSVEEWFISKLLPGDVFWFAGKSLEIQSIRGNEVYVKKTKRKSGKIPSWQGGRMSLSSELSEMLRKKMTQAVDGTSEDPEIEAISSLLEFQKERSIVPRENQLLIEYIQSKDGYHLFVYPFEGRQVHEGLSALLAYRLSMLRPFTFSVAFNDYGFELLADEPIPVQEALDNDFFTTEYLQEHIEGSINATEMARRRFRDIANISGLIFQGYPGKQMRNKHLQSSTALLFNVFRDYEPNHLLIQQSYTETYDFQLEETRLRKSLERIQSQEIVLVAPELPTPFSFPIMADRLRERFTTEKLEDRINQMVLRFS